MIITEKFLKGLAVHFYIVIFKTIPNYQKIELYEKQYNLKTTIDSLNRVLTRSCVGCLGNISASEDLKITPKLDPVGLPYISELKKFPSLTKEAPKAVTIAILSKIYSNGLFKCYNKQIK